MKCFIFRNVAFLAVTIASLALANPAYADCASPSAEEGVMMYNTTYKTMQFCDGSHWWNMKGFDGPTYSGADGQIGFYSGNQLLFSSGIYLSSSGNVGIGTLAPAAMIHVAGDIRFDSGALRFPDGTTQTTASSGSNVVDGSLLAAAGGFVEGGSDLGSVTGAGWTTVWSRLVYIPVGTSALRGKIRGRITGCGTAYMNFGLFDSVPGSTNGQSGHFITSSTSNTDSAELTMTVSSSGWKYLTAHAFNTSGGCTSVLNGITVYTKNP